MQEIRQHVMTSAAEALALVNVEDIAAFVCFQSSP
jgi:hypothetical protein